jgi:hypothetical protein
MLDCDLHRLGPGTRVRGGQIVGMQVVRYHLRLDPQEPLETFDRLAERLERFEVLQVSDVRPEVSRIAGAYAEGVLQQRTASQHRRRKRCGARNRPRHEAARSAKQHGTAGNDARDGIVAAGLDLTVVDDQHVGEGTQTFNGFFVAVRQRLFGQVTRRHHQRPAGLFDEQQVQRRVGKQQADQRVARSNLVRDEGVRAALGEHDGPFDRQQQPAFFAGQICEPVGVVDIPNHDRKRLLVTPLPLPQPVHRLGGTGIAREMEAADPLQRDYPSRAQSGGRTCDRISPTQRRASGRKGRDFGPAGRARVWLRVEPPVFHRVVLALAVAAHAERRHRGKRPVVRHVARDREARPAIGAVREGVAMPAIGGVEDLALAVGACCQVGRNGDVPLVGVAAGLDSERVNVLRGYRGPAHLLDGRGRGRGGLEQRQEPPERSRRAERLDGDATSVVADAAGDRGFAREPVDPWPEAHTLHHALDLDAAPLEARDDALFGVHRPPIGW